MTGYEFHPEARFDLDEIWYYIRADNLTPIVVLGPASAAAWR